MIPPLCRDRSRSSWTPGAEGLLAKFVFIRQCKWARCHRYYHRHTGTRWSGYRRICSVLGVPICLGVSLFKFSNISYSNADHVGNVSFTGCAVRFRVCIIIIIIMGLTLPSSLRHAALVFLSLAIAGVSGDCNPSASSFDFVRLTDCYAPFSCLLLL